MVILMIDMSDPYAAASATANRNSSIAVPDSNPVTNNWTEFRLRQGKKYAAELAK